MLLLGRVVIRDLQPGLLGGEKGVARTMGIPLHELWGFHYTNYGDPITRTMGTPLYELWGFHYTDYGDPIVRTMGIPLYELWGSHYIRELLSLFFSSEYDHDGVAIRELKSNNFECKKCVAIRGCCY